MDITISGCEKANEEGRDYYTIDLTVGKTRAIIVKGSNDINVVSGNALRKPCGGRYFWSWEEAESAYKSAAMKTAIQTAREEFARIDAEEAQESAAIDLAEESPVESDPIAAWEAIAAEVHADEFSKRMKEGNADEILADYFAREDAAKEQLKQAAWEKTKHVNHKETIMGLSMDAPSDLNWVLGVLSS